MSSEATDLVDSLAAKQQIIINECGKNIPPKTTKDLEEAQVDNINRTNKKFKKNGHSNQADTNHLEKNSKPQDGRKMRELSFFPGDDDSEESSSPLNLKISNKWITNNNKSTEPTKVVDDNNTTEDRNVNNNSPHNKKDDCKLDEPVNLDQNGDESSTSSCSCEDHSSVAGPSEHEDHEDLDYDDDSISDSLPGTSNNTQEPSYPPSSSPSNHKRVVAKGIISSNSDSSILRTDYTHKSSLDNNINDRKQEKSNSSNQNSSRIKSVINVNHDIDGKLIKPKNGDKTSNDKSHKSYECLLKYFFKDACYFQIKSINHENVELSKSMGVWSTPIQNEIRLNTAFREHRNVILIFSVQQSGGFQGFARMVSESKPSSKAIPWVLPERLSKKSLGGVLRVEWLCTKELPFHETHDLYNPYNDNKPVKVARDGQQVEPKTGKKLCKLFPRDSKENLLTCLTTLKRQISQRKKSLTRHDNFYPLTDRRGYIEERHRQNYLPIQGTNGIGEPCVPSHISHDYNLYASQGKAYRPLSRRRMFDHPNQGIYHRQNIYSNLHGSPRPNHMPRNVDVMSRCLMPGEHEDFHHGYGHTSAHQYANQYANPMGIWAHNPDMVRYHPYQRSRR